MTNIREIIGLKTTTGDLGLEIEVEGINLPVFPRANYWKCEYDGSLRGESIEYVLTKPLSLPEIKLALDHLNSLYKQSDARPTESFRAGVHVHVNCQELTFVELFNLMTLYMIFETLFIKWCGKSREGNLFCLSTSDAEYVLEELRLALVYANDNNNLNYFLALIRNEDMIRYSSMNLGALKKYGSLEFRAMRSTPNLDLIYGWASVLLGLREKAKTYNDPQQIMQMFSYLGVDKFIDDVLGYDVAKMFLASSKNYWNDITQGIRNAQEMAFTGHWDHIKSISPQINNQKFGRGEHKVVPADGADLDKMVRELRREFLNQAVDPRGAINVPKRVELQ